MFPRIFLGVFVIFLAVWQVGAGKFQVSPAADPLVHTGYVTVDGEECGNRLFYYFAEAKKVSPKDAPFILWLTGGPGVSSMTAAFIENGPYLVQEDASVKANSFGWNEKMNILYFDQPAGTGFSVVGKGDSCYVTNENELSTQLYEALRKFFDEFPEFVGLDFYIFGESYAGKYIPSFATYIMHQNDRGLNFQVNLKGFAIGDGWMEPLSQTHSFIDFLHGMGLIGSFERKMYLEMYEAFVQASLDGDYDLAYNLTNSISDGLLQVAGGPNMYDVRYFGGEPIDPLIAALDTYFKKPDVRREMGVDTDWSFANNKVGDALYYDFLKNTTHLMPELLKRYRALIYSGQYDYVCNHVGTDAWLSALDWPHRQDYVEAPRFVWKVDGDVAGSGKTVDSLTHLVVYGAGHQAPANQPKTTLDMAHRFVYRQPFY